MNRPIIGITVGTSISPSRLEKDIRPVKTVNGIPADKDGNVDINSGSGSTLTLIDRKTAKKYVLYVSDGKLTMEESEE